MNLAHFTWINPPKIFDITGGSLTITTEPETDFWQRTYYGFRNDNAHAFIIPVDEQSFTFSVRAAWTYQTLFDQCGIVLYQDSDNWCKASVEYDNPSFSRLGSVVTNLGYSDWATTDIDSAITHMAYRLSRRGQDFLIENSLDGQTFQQMRIFHLHAHLEAVRIGVYACSPLKSSFEAEFSAFHLGECLWEAHHLE